MVVLKLNVACTLTFIVTFTRGLPQAYFGAEHFEDERRDSLITSQLIENENSTTT